ncbi:MAG: cell division protein [Bacteroidetes bacterium]|nr:MAG: cell division protein [Spirochaetota bacterium]RLD40966.1 MAG: cell division protein [Bacteroidota bacterium]
MARKNEYGDIKEAEKVNTVLSDTTSFNGIMKFKTSLKINGKFNGEIISEGFLIVGERATVKANIKADSVVIAGEVKGNVEARERLELLSTGKLYGNIKTKKLKMADGVIFEGKCEMIRPDMDKQVDRSGILSTSSNSIGVV